MPKASISGLFGSSPIRPLQQHMASVQRRWTGARYRGTQHECCAYYFPLLGHHTARRGAAVDPVLLYAERHILYLGA